MDGDLDSSVTKWLPTEFKNIAQNYSKKGISTLFPWQIECLTSTKVLQGRNLIYTAPTSAGKSMILDIIALT